MLRIVALVCLWGFAVVPAAALEPTKPSQLVTGLATSLGDSPSPPCASLYKAFVVDRIAKPDGTAGPFAIPPKSVLVITSVDFALSTGASRYETFTVAAIDLANPPTTAETLPNVAFSGAIADAGGRVNGSIVIPGGLVVKPPAVPCVQGGSSFEAAVVAIHGFFTKDK